MEIKFLNYWVLFLIPFAAAIIFAIGMIDFKSKKIIKNKFSCFLTLFRMIIITLIMLSLSEPQINLINFKTQTMFIADNSYSVGKSDEILGFINDKLKAKPADEEVGFMIFGENSAIEKMPEKENNHFEIKSDINKEGSNIEQALHNAVSVMDKDKSKRIVLISDGGENIGSALNEAENIVKSGAEVDTLFIENNLKNEIQLSQLNADTRVNKNALYEIEAVIYSVSDNTASIALYKNNNLICERNIELQKGENKFLFSDTADDGGGITLKAEISSQNDTFKDNNVGFCYVYVDDAPQILIIENDSGSGKEIYSALSQNGFNGSIVKAGNEYDLASLVKYDEIIIADCSYDDLGEKTIDNIENYVKNSGGGLFVTGGKYSFGMGGYENTALEKILPVNMKPVDDAKEYDLSMVIVLDRSASMSAVHYGVSALSIAKEAASASLDALKDKDSLAVIAFDSFPETVVNLEKVGENRKSIKDNINSISVGMGTSILPALDDAVSRLEASKSRYKHIILMTDGQAETSGYSYLINRINNGGITLSCVGVGSDADTQLLQNLAQAGNGRYYYTDQFTDLPKIFADETKSAGKEFLNEIDFYPEAAGDSPIISNIDNIPMLNGYIASSFKPNVEAVLKTQKNEPVLAFMRYGLGKTGVFATDTSNWCSEWFSSNEGMEIFIASVSKVLKNNDSAGMEAEIKAENGKNYVYVKTYDSSIIINSGKITGTESEVNLEFKAVSSNIYRAETKNLDKGFYTINIEYQDENAKKADFTAYDFVSWAREYDFSGLEKNKEFLEELAYACAGKVIDYKSNIFDKIEPKAYKNKNLSNILMTISLFLFIIDIGMRKFKEFLYYAFVKYFLKENKAIKKIKENEINEAENSLKDKNIIDKEPDKKLKTAEILARNKKKRNGR